MLWQEITHFFKNFGLKILGVLLIIGGIIGLFLPFLQGVLMITVGFALMGNKTAVKKLAQFKKWLKSRKKSCR
jgi:uncharacterized membrane protein YbaN (DUF454 family)